ncbi:unnamed protein product, partial [Plutella xylostella]
ASCAARSSQGDRINGRRQASILTRDSDTESLASACSAGPDAHDTHDAVFVVGALDETIMLRGMRYHPHRYRELGHARGVHVDEPAGGGGGTGRQRQRGPLNLVPLVTNTVLEEQHLIVGVVVVVDPGVVPINSRGEKQRMHLRDGLVAHPLSILRLACPPSAVSSQRSFHSTSDRGTPRSTSVHGTSTYFYDSPSSLLVRQPPYLRVLLTTAAQPSSTPRARNGHVTWPLGEEDFHAGRIIGIPHRYSSTQGSPHPYRLKSD